MKRFIKGFISSLIAVCFLFGAFGCGGKDSVTVNDGYTFANPDHITYEGTHEFDVQDVEGEYLVKNGKTDYIIVFPSVASTMVIDVKTDLLILFKKATGIALPVKYDYEVENTWDESKKYISIGETSLVERAGISEEEYSENVIKSEGVRIITKGNTVFLLNTHDFGICNAVYTFLEIYFNFDYYHRNCITIDTGVTDKLFKKIDVTDIPDVEHYMGAHNIYTYYKRSDPWDADALGLETYVQEGKFIAMRLRSHSNLWEFPIHAEFTSDSTSAASHNFLEYIPKGKKVELPFSGETITTNEKMFSEIGKRDQLCLSAHGDPEAYENMIKICTEKILWSLHLYTPDAWPYRNGATITMEDSFDHCKCPWCLEDYDNYGPSGQTIRFANEVGKRVNEWLQKNAKAEDSEYHYLYRDKVTIYIFGYHQDVDPPVDIIENADGTKTYIPKDESVIFNEYTSVWLVSSNSLRLGGFYDVMQGNGHDHLPGWKAVSNGLNESVYWFNSPIGNRDYAYDAFTTYSKNFWANMAYYGFSDVFSDHYGSGNELTGWQTMLTYLNSKLRWDCNRDPNEYIQKYMKAMYHDAADIMYDIYQDQMAYYLNIRANMTDPSRPQPIGSAEYWPYGVLDGWVQRFESAIDLISFYQEIDIKLYNTIKTRIQIEMAGEISKIFSFYLDSRPFSVERLIEYKKVMAELGEKSPVMAISGQNVADLGK